ncbi:MAG: hypothetical protein R8P61_12065 [Bacteroidia bacterium]|nr:hypothetical protein [Bacteroidia bacterium]
MSDRARPVLKRFISIYALSLGGIALLIFLVLIFSGRVPGKELLPVYLESLRIIFSSLLTYLLALIPFLGYLLIQNLKTDFQKGGMPKLVKGISLKIALPAFLIFIGLNLLSIYRESEEFDYSWDDQVLNEEGHIRDLYKVDGKQRGIHVFDLNDDTLDLEILKRNNVEWITFVPFINQKSIHQPELGSRIGRTNRTARLKRLKRYFTLAQKHGFYLMLKPHIWLSSDVKDGWRSDIQMVNQASWDIWFEEYRSYMIPYAELAQEMGVEILCIGTELNQSVMDQPEQWLSLIRDIRKIYKGQLTYAANWSDDLGSIPFWKELDHIGIQAYFPLAENINPNLAELEAGWEKHLGELEDLSERFDRPVLFTEIGYKSTADAGQKPWEWNSVSNSLYKKISHKTQALCYQALFNTIWEEEWLSGVHIWEWKSRGKSEGKNHGFTLEGKPALNVVAKGFARQMNRFPFLGSRHKGARASFLPRIQAWNNSPSISNNSSQAMKNDSAN